jgi:dTDP-4-amino-4,6-dideoxygalactose transaminase
MVVVFIGQIIERDKMPALAQKTNKYEDNYLLTINDRCDACGGQAYVAVTGTKGELMFCAHHYNKIMSEPIGFAAMERFAVETVDERERLEIKSTVYI